jgi:hypothetical protein
MRRLALALLLALSLPAHAQLTKCIDQRGRVMYTDKPIPGCKPTAQQPTPAPQRPQPPAAKKDSSKAIAKAAAKAKPAPPPSVNECKAAREQREWLLSDRGKEVGMREARIAQVEQTMRKCR